MVLERGKPVGHGRMAGIAGFGKQAEIGQAQCLYQPGPFQEFRAGRHLAEAGMQEHDHDKHDKGSRENEENGGFAHQAV
jgi:hypothetical protein